MDLNMTPPTTLEKNVVSLSAPETTTAMDGTAERVSMSYDERLITRMEDALKALSSGEFIIVMDNEDRENEGDLIALASTATTERLAFMLRHTSGIICVGCPEDRLATLALPLMVPRGSNTEAHSCTFTVSVDLKEGTTTGVSASDRAATIRALGNPAVSAAAFNKPGHVFPLSARDGGVLARAGHTEASVDLARLAHHYATHNTFSSDSSAPMSMSTSTSTHLNVGYLCEIQDRDGTMLTREALKQFGVTHKLRMITISDIIRYRFLTEVIMTRVDDEVPEMVSTLYGPSPLIAFTSEVFTSTCHALVVGHPFDRPDDESISVYFVDAVTVAGQMEAARVHQQLHTQGAGILLYLPEASLLKRNSGEDMANQTLLGCGLHMCRALGLSRVQILQSTPLTFTLEGFGMSTISTQELL